MEFWLSKFARLESTWDWERLVVSMQKRGHTACGYVCFFKKKTSFCKRRFFCEVRNMMCAVHQSEHTHTHTHKDFHFSFHFKKTKAHFKTRNVRRH